jgi:hypothetical protein
MSMSTHWPRTGERIAFAAVFTLTQLAGIYTLWNSFEFAVRFNEHVFALPHREALILAAVFEGLIFVFSAMTFLLTCWRRSHLIPSALAILGALFIGTLVGIDQLTQHGWLAFAGRAIVPIAGVAVMEMGYWLLKQRTLRTAADAFTDTHARLKAWTLDMAMAWLVNRSVYAALNQQRYAYLHPARTMRIEAARNRAEARYRTAKRFMTDAQYDARADRAMASREAFDRLSSRARTLAQTEKARTAGTLDHASSEHEHQRVSGEREHGGTDVSTEHTSTRATSVSSSASNEREQRERDHVSASVSSERTNVVNLHAHEHTSVSTPVSTTTSAHDTPAVESDITGSLRRAVASTSMSASIDEQTGIVSAPLTPAPRAARRRITDDTKAQIRAGRDAGHTQRQVAGRLGIATGSVAKFWNNNQ